MPFTGGKAELVDRAMFMARIGEIAADSEAVIAAEIEAESWIEVVFHKVTEIVSKDPERSHLLMHSNDVTLVDGIGSLAGFLTEYIEVGGVRDEDGNVLVRVHNYDDFLKYLPAVYGYYCLRSNQIYTREIGTGSFTGTSGPLEIDAPVVPTADTVPDELMDEVCSMLAARIRYGVLAPSRVAM